MTAREKGEAMLRRKDVVRLAAVLCCCSAISAQESGKLPGVKIIATGGTIAGEAASSAQAEYKSGQVGVEALIKAVPTLNKIAQVSGEQISNVGSRTCPTKSGLSWQNASISLRRRPM